MNKRQKAILKRNIFLSACVVVVIAVLALIIYVISTISGDKDTTSSTATSSQNISSEVTSSVDSSSTETSSTDTSSTESEEPSSSEITSSKKPTKKLDKDFQNLTLVNGWNPLPEDYDYEGNLTTIPQKYIKGSLKEIDKDVWPYLKAMLDDARAEGIDIGVWSPYRSYNTQKWLFEKQVKKQIANGVPESEAEDKAATVVARPGTSEHNTGLALDINCANSSFENTKAYKWLTKNAENYGFIMRYRKDKQEKTGVIHESWHWRFVGINAAKEINRLDMCLEEYVEYKK
ncbi:MAG: M15 family metallopeptidase [Clostridia bacterium]|nr:M15 family metallopeptidase [Clostridia bacterium]